VPRDLRVEGRELAGVHFAMEFLVGNTKAVLAGNGAVPPISAKDKSVIVIGGGDTGTDCVGTAIRQGAKSVTQLEILSRPPETRAKDNPWPQWPKIYKLDYGQEEAAALWGADPRRYSVNTRRLVGNEEGRVSAIETVEIEWALGESGRMEMRPKDGTEQVLAADLVLLALGFVGPAQDLPAAFGCKLDGRGNIVHDNEMMTTVPVSSPPATAPEASPLSCGDPRRPPGRPRRRQVPDVRRVGPAGLLGPAATAQRRAAPAKMRCRP